MPFGRAPMTPKNLQQLQNFPMAREDAWGHVLEFGRPDPLGEWLCAAHQSSEYRLSIG